MNKRLRLQEVYDIQFQEGISYGKAVVIYEADLKKKRALEVRKGRILHCRDSDKNFDKYAKIIPILCRKHVKKESVITEAKDFLDIYIPRQCEECRTIAIRRAAGFY